MRKALLATHNPHSSHFISGACVFLVEISLTPNTRHAVMCPARGSVFSLVSWNETHHYFTWQNPDSSQALLHPSVSENCLFGRRERPAVSFV